MEDFRLNEVCTTSKGSRYVGTYYSVEQVPMWDDIQGQIEYEEVDYYGFHLMPEGYTNKDVVISENKLFLDGYEVTDYPDWVEKYGSLSNEVPRLFCLYKFDEKRGYKSFQGGFDLLNDGRAWEGLTRTEYPSISEALQFVREKLGDGFPCTLR